MTPAPYYADEHVQLYLGDCLELDVWTVADVLVTDPPYGVGYAAKRGGQGRRSKGHTPELVQNDHDFTAATTAVRSWGPQPMAVFANHASLPRTLQLVAEQLHRIRVATWHKSNVALSAPGNPWFADVEFAVCAVMEWPRTPRSGLLSAKRFTGNPAWNKSPDAYLHPTQKPIALMEQLLQAMPGGVVADPFAGSGSTLVAARNLGRRAIGVEIEERYCETIAKRLSQGALDLEGLSG